MATPLLRPLRGVGRYVNPGVLPIAPRIPPLAVVEHNGRRSGAPYRTPVQAFPAEDGWVIALTYGPDVDWARNVLAAGGAEIVRAGRRYRVTAPRLLNGAAGRDLLPAWSRVVMRPFRIEDYLHARTVSENAA